MSIMLHTCCGPCLAYIINFYKENDDCVPFWYNPNIQPYREFVRRLDNFKISTITENTIIDDTYDIDLFFNSVNCGQNRCKGCYTLRIEKTASVASQKKFNSFSTTLLSSPHQDHNLIKEIGEEMAERYSIPFLYLDLRQYHTRSKDKARKMGLYLQSYCGCIWSEMERYAIIDEEEE